MKTTHSTFVECLACKGRGVATDTIHNEDGTRLIHRTVCPACRGKGVVDILRGPIPWEILK